MSWDFLGVGLLASIVTVACFWPTQIRERSAPLADSGRGETGIWITAFLLVVFGIGVYLPMPAMSGRYTMPAVWGLDLAFAGLLGMLLAVRIAPWRRLALAGIVGGLVVVAAANVGRQQKFVARSALLWQTLEYVEREADPETRLAWIASAGLNVEEGIHFQWHLLARGKRRIAVELLDERGRPEERCELPAARGDATLAVTGSPQPPPGSAWLLRQEFHAPFWGGRRHYDCYLWTSTVAVSTASDTP
jgi:hypothetical protein